jgi:hypothetical protein
VEERKRGRKEWIFKKISTIRGSRRRWKLLKLSFRVLWLFQLEHNLFIKLINLNQPFVGFCARAKSEFCIFLWWMFTIYALKYSWILCENSASDRKNINLVLWWLITLYRLFWSNGQIKWYTGEVLSWALTLESTINKTLLIDKLPLAKILKKKCWDIPYSLIIWEYLFTKQLIKISHIYDIHN